MEIRKAVGFVAISVVALTVLVVWTWAVVAPPDRELPVEVPVEAPVEVQKEPVHTVKQSVVDCDVIYDNSVFFLALCIKPQTIESDK